MFGFLAFVELIGAWGLSGLSNVLVPRPRYAPNSQGGPRSSSDYGTGIPRVWGTVRLGGNLLWTTSPAERWLDLAPVYVDSDHHIRQDIGGKRIVVDCAFALCRGPIAGVLEVRVNGEPLYTRAANALGDALYVSDKMEAAVRGVQQGIRFYLGGEAQAADELITATYAAQGIDAPAFKGITYVLLHDFDLGPYGGALPDFSFTVVQSGTVSATTKYLGDPEHPGDLYDSTVLTPSAVSLATLLQDLCVAAGFAAGDVDVSDVSGTVTGAWVDGERPVADALRSICRVAGLDVIEAPPSGIRFVPKGSGAVITVDTEDLVALDDVGTRVETVRRDTAGLPRRVTVRYFDDKFAYQSAAASAQDDALDLRGERGEETVECPLVLDSTTARRAAQSLLDEKWMGLTTHRARLTRQYLQVEPGDRLALPVAGGTATVRVTQADIGADLTVAIAAVDHDDSIYVGTLSGVDITTPETLVANPLGQVARLLDAPGPGTQQGRPGVWVLSSSVQRAYRDAILFLSRDGVTYENTGVIIPAIPYGLTTATVSRTGVRTGTWDTATAIDVDFARGTPASATDDEVLRGKNLALLTAEWAVGGNDRRYAELFQFGAASLLSGTTYRLTRLLRERHGMTSRDLYTGTPFPVGAEVWLLDDAPFYPLDARRPLDRLWCKVVPSGYAPDDVAALQLSPTGQSFAPYPPAALAGARNGGGDLTVTWARRSQYGQELPDGVDVELGEESEMYAITVYSLSGGAYITVRTATTTSPTWTYTAAEQTTDFGAPQSVVTVGVQQYSTRGTRSLAAYADL